MQNLPKPSTFFVVSENGRNAVTGDTNAAYRNYAYEAYMELVKKNESGEQISQEEVDENLKCPITLAFFADPVITPSGQTYESKVITEWLQTNNTDPLSRESLEVSQLRPNAAIKQIVDDLIKADERPASELERGMGNRTFAEVFAGFSERLHNSFSLAARFAAGPAVLGATSTILGTEACNRGRPIEGAALVASGTTTVGSYVVPTSSIVIGGGATTTLAAGLFSNTVVTSADAANVSFQGCSQETDQGGDSEGNSLTC